MQRVVLAAVTVALVLAPALSPAVADGPRRKKAPAVDVAGVYTSNYGEVRLRQYGAYVEGEYVCCGGGRIDGKITGKVLRYHWEGADGSGGGYGVWTVVDRRTLRGTWGSDESDDDGGEWNLDKVEGTEIAN